MNIQDKINILKWRIKNRLPGGVVFERTLANIKGLNLSPDDPMYYAYWNDLFNDSFKAFFLGSKAYSNQNFDQFSTWLEDHYYDVYSDSFRFNTNGIPFYLPVPSREDYELFRFEFLDLIMPYITGDKNIPLNEGLYEYDNVKLEYGDTVLDIGANYGMFSAYASTKASAIYAFEPSTDIIYRYLSKTAFLNPNIEIVNKAVSDQNGVEEYCYDAINFGSSTLQRTGRGGNLEVSTVPSTTVDSFVAENNIHVDFIKCDIEGAERYMLEGARDTIKNQQPKIAICYYHRADDIRVITKLIKDANPNYTVVKHWKKLFAHVQKKKLLKK